MSNTLYLLLPIEGVSGNGNAESSYLNTVDIQTADDVTKLLIDIYKNLSYVFYEKFAVKYDNDKLKALIDSAKAKNKGRLYPEALKILALFDKKPFSSFNKASTGANVIVVNGIKVCDGILNNYISNKTSHDVITDPDVLNCDPRSLIVKDLNGNIIDLRDVFVKCDAEKLYHWFVENRYPERELDFNYKKHTSTQREGSRGVISPLTYSKKELEDFLKKAVGTENAKNLFFKDNTKNKIIVFWNENLANPTYHAYEISVDDEKEIDKIYSKGNRMLIRKIDEHAKQ